MTSQLYKASSGSNLPNIGGSLKKGKTGLDINKKGNKLGLNSKDERAPHEIEGVEMSRLEEIKTQ
jgi:hypothetical protein